jgi:hypothetical protein
MFIIYVARPAVLSPSEKVIKIGNIPIPLTTGQRSRSDSTQSLASSRSSVSTRNGKISPNSKLAAKPIATVSFYILHVGVIHCVKERCYISPTLKIEGFKSTDF